MCQYFIKSFSLHKKCVGVQLLELSTISGTQQVFTKYLLNE